MCGPIRTDKAAPTTQNLAIVSETAGWPVPVVEHDSERDQDRPKDNHAPRREASQENQVLPEQRGLRWTRQRQRERRGPRSIRHGHPAFQNLSHLFGTFRRCLLERRVRAHDPHEIHGEQQPGSGQHAEELGRRGRERQAHERSEGPEHDGSRTARAESLELVEDVDWTPERRQQRPVGGHGSDEHHAGNDDQRQGSHSRARPACPCFLRLSRLKETPIRFRFIVVIKIDTPTKNVHPLARLDGLKMTVTMALPRAVATSERRSLTESIAGA